MSDDRLLPCPFCGQPPYFKPKGEIMDARIMCDNTACLPRVYVWAPTNAAAIAAWNRRAPAAPPAIVRALVEALEAANQFITNGIELGFIRMPDASTPDPAHKTPDRIRAAIAAAKEAGL